MKDKVSYVLCAIGVIAYTAALITIQNSFLIFIIGLILQISIWFYLYSYNNITIYSKLIILIIINTPFSFMDIFGKSYNNTYISWFNISLILIVVYSSVHLIRNRISYFGRESVFSLTLILSMVTILLVNQINGDAVKQFINMLAVPVVVLLVSMSRNSSNIIGEELLNIITKLLLATITATSVLVLLQAASFYLFDYEFGYIMEYGLSRKAFGFFFTDFSFLSVYLAIGTLASSEIYKKNKNVLYAIVAVITVSASIITSARTGVASLAGALIFAFVDQNRKDFKHNKKDVILKVGVIVSLSILALYLFYLIRGAEVFNSSDRDKLINEAIRIFLNKPIVGVGFGRMNYFNSFGIIPHNVIFQTLVQGGVVLFIPLILFFGVYIINQKHNVFFYMYVMILLSSMFIPDIFSSRVIIINLLVLTLSEKTKKVGVNNEDTSCNK